MTEGWSHNHIRKCLVRAVGDILPGAEIEHEAPCGTGRIDMLVCHRSKRIGFEIKHTVRKSRFTAQLENYAPHLDLLIVVCSLDAAKALTKLALPKGLWLFAGDIEPAVMAVRDGAYPAYDPASYDDELKFRRALRHIGRPAQRARMVRRALVSS